MVACPLCGSRDSADTIEQQFRHIVKRLIEEDEFEVFLSAVPEEVKRVFVCSVLDGMPEESEE